MGARRGVHRGDGPHSNQPALPARRRDSEDLVLRVLDRTARLAEERGIALRPAVVEAGVILNAVIGEAYSRMRDIDRQLRGGGYPKRVPPQSIEAKVARMNEFVSALVAGRVAVGNGQGSNADQPDGPPPLPEQDESGAERREEQRERYSSIAEEANRRWQAKKTLSLNAIARQMAPFEGLGAQTIRKFLRGAYKPAQKFGYTKPDSWRT